MSAASGDYNVSDRLINELKRLNVPNHPVDGGTAAAEAKTKSFMEGLKLHCERQRSLIQGPKPLPIKTVSLAPKVSESIKNLIDTFKSKIVAEGGSPTQTSMLIRMEAFLLGCHMDSGYKEDRRKIMTAEIKRLYPT